jgi:hypothetical protein
MTSQKLHKPWQEVCCFVQVALNSRASTTLGGKSPMYFLFGTEFNYRRKNNLKLSDIPDLKAQKEIWRLHDVVCNKIIKDYNQERNRLNQKLGGKSQEFKPGSYVWIKNFTRIPKQKMNTRFLSEPLIVVRNFDNVLLVKSPLGVVLRIHKNNLKPYYDRDLRLYNALPLKSRLLLGSKFDQKELFKYFDDIAREEPELIIKDAQTAEPLLPEEVVNDVTEAELRDDGSESDSDDDQVPPYPELGGLNRPQNVVLPGKRGPRTPSQPLHMNLRKRVTFL